MTEVRPHRDLLTFHFLDDVLLLPHEESQQKIAQALIHQIGPLAEYALYAPVAASACLCQSKSAAAQSLFNVLLGKGTQVGLSAQARPVEFFRTPQDNANFDNDDWVGFCMRLQSAAKKAGLLEGFARELAGTFEEMVGNIVEHSEHPETGVVGYAWKPGEFEYVVADAGIGVMKSLKKHPDYAHLSDAGQALETALMDGESCLGKAALRGRGFRTLILNIASRNSLLRFRSGDHCHIVDGTKSVPRFTSQLCSDFQGFHISVVCHP